MRKLDLLLTSTLSVLVIGVISVNVKKQMDIDRSRIPVKVELHKKFQKWITNMKNKGVQIKTDEFKLKEENEIYNTRWMRVDSIDTPGKKEEYDLAIKSMEGVKKVEFSPSKRLYIDYRNIDRNGYASNEVIFYGLNEDKIINARILDCSIRANCYFDRAFFLENEIFVVAEISRTIDKKGSRHTLVCNVPNMSIFG